MQCWLLVHKVLRIPNGLTNLTEANIIKFLKTLRYVNCLLVRLP